MTKLRLHVKIKVAKMDIDVAKMKTATNSKISIDERCVTLLSNITKLNLVL